MTTLDKLMPGDCATVKTVGGAGSAIYQRLMEMGVFDGAELRVIRFAPLGDPMEVQVQGYNLSLRKAEAALVEVDVQSH
jgi:Fe2+ transport system protein FeoA